MTYLRIRNFWDYQNADVWKKAKANKKGHRHPPWCKLYVARDLEIDALPPITRLVFYELLRLATVTGNVIPNDISTIANAISIPRQEVAKAIPMLLKGAWLSETKTSRRSREFLDQKQIEKKKKEVPKSSSNGYVDERAVGKLLRALTDADDLTGHTIRKLVRKFHLTEGDLMWARECATGPGVNSAAAVAISELVKRGEARRPSAA